MQARNAIDIAGQRFGRLMAIAESPTRMNGRRIGWVVRCDCGSEKVILGSSLRCGTTTSCGCAQRDAASANAISRTTHGHTNSPTYNSWCGMKKRCYTTSAPEFKYYGLRGIAVCARWMSFENFLSDMGEKPAGLTLDRIDVNGDYEPENCRWATMQEQARNRRKHRLLTANGATLPLWRWAEIIGMRPASISTRIDVYGWSHERAINTPVNSRSIS